MLKSFFRTAWGKLLLTAACLFFLMIAAACTVSLSLTAVVSHDRGRIHLLTWGDYEQYESELTEQARSKAWHVLDSLLNNGFVQDEGDYVYHIRNRTKGNLVYVSDDASGGVMFTFSFYAFLQGLRHRIAIEPGDVTGDVFEWYEVQSSPRNLYLFNLRNQWCERACRLGWWSVVIGLAALAMAGLNFWMLMKVSARRAGRDGLFPGPLHKVPYDLMLAAVIALFIGIAWFVDWIIPVDSSEELYLTLVVLAGGAAVFLGLSMSTAARVKTKTLIKNTLIFRILKYLVAKPLAWLWKGLKKLHAFNMSILRGLPLVGKTALFLGVLAIVELNVTAAADGGPLVLLSLIKYLILIPLVLYLALCLRRLQKGGEALAAGDLAYQTDTKGLPHDLKKHAEDLNSIGGGMAIAVREQLKSERMKTELITNVSHDLKTPLTSVINYADLIGKEPCENAKIKEYSGVLLRQSERLKRLIDDLVEASKASTGNLEVDLVPCDASVFLAQAAGEYEEKLRDAGLALVTKQPDEEVSIMADGRRMWRIFDNLMNNIVKYSLSGTRVYLSLEQADGDAVITFRNTSREPLDAVNTEELVERFTRGDASRNTEGSGLGLAIAKSLTELQGGKFLVSADGDLFKVILRFPKI